MARTLLAELLLAAQFLTRLPLPARGYTPARMARTPRHFAAVGLVLGLAAAALLWLAAQAWPQPLAALGTTAALLVATGALHEDGLADSLDGLGGGRDAARALDIMRDSRIGSYGALGLMVMLAGQVAALATLALPAAMGALVLGHCAGRAAMALALGQGRYLRARGIGTGLDRPLGAGGLGLTGAALALGLAAAAPGLGGAGLGAALGGAVLAGAGWRRLALRRLGGDTGDTLGALHCCTLTGTLLGAAAWA